MVTGGPMLSGNYKGKKVGTDSMFEAIGKVAAGKMDEKELKCLEDVACPSMRFMQWNVYSKHNGVCY